MGKSINLCGEGYAAGTTVRRLIMLVANEDDETWGESGVSPNPKPKSITVYGDQPSWTASTVPVVADDGVMVNYRKGLKLFGRDDYRTRVPRTRR